MKKFQIDTYGLMHPNLSDATRDKVRNMTLVEMLTLADRIATDAADPDHDAEDASHDEQQILIELHRLLTGLVVPCVAAALDPLVNPYFNQDDDDDNVVSE